MNKPTVKLYLDERRAEKILRTYRRPPKPYRRPAPLKNTIGVKRKPRTHAELRLDFVAAFELAALALNDPLDKLVVAIAGVALHKKTLFIDALPIWGDA